MRNCQIHRSQTLESFKLTVASGLNTVLVSRAALQNILEEGKRELGATKLIHSLVRVSIRPMSRSCGVISVPAISGVLAFSSRSIRPAFSARHVTLALPAWRGILKLKTSADSSVRRRRGSGLANCPRIVRI